MFFDIGQQLGNFGDGKVDRIPWFSACFLSWPAILRSISAKVWNGGFSSIFAYRRPLFGNLPVRSPNCTPQFQLVRRVMISFLMVAGAESPRIPFILERRSTCP